MLTIQQGTISSWSDLENNLKRAMVTLHPTSSTSQKSRKVATACSSCLIQRHLSSTQKRTTDVLNSKNQGDSKSQGRPQALFSTCVKSTGTPSKCRIKATSSTTVARLALSETKDFKLYKTAIQKQILQVVVLLYAPLSKR